VAVRVMMRFAFYSKAIKWKYDKPCRIISNKEGLLPRQGGSMDDPLRLVSLSVRGEQMEETDLAWQLDTQQ
jgi:hypothetical protein